MNFQEFIKKLQNLPDKQKKIILWATVAILALVMALFWFRGTMNKLSKLGEEVSKIQLPQIEMPETEIPSLTEETADWKTYKNDEYGFEIKYPNNFQLKQEYNEIYLLQAKGPVIYLFAGKNLSAAFLECGGRCSYQKSIVALSEKDGDWNKDYIFDYGGMGSWDTVINAYQQKNEIYYIFSLYSPQQLGVPGFQGEGKPTREELITPALESLQDKNNNDVVIFNQILSTFKFLE